MNKFNTAVLYDIENLIGGYGKEDLISTISLVEIAEKINEKIKGKFAIQRAYANWSNPKLSILRGDIVELGVEPIQMFGFGKGPQKNASDIELTIDAMEIALTNPNINIFVIVSGDGGFSSLARKLHEYGKSVIGCAYRKTTNRVFEAVSDDFIWLNEPVTSEKEINSEFTDPILISYAKKYQPIEFKKQNEILEEAKNILIFFTKDRESSYLLRTNGLNISKFSALLSYRIKNFNYFSLGFVKFVDFIRYVINNTELKLILRLPSEYRIIYKNVILKNFEDVKEMKEIGEIHSLENYNTILSKTSPIFRLPSNSDIIFEIINELNSNKIEYQELSLGDLIEKMNDKFIFEQKDIKNTLTSLIAANIITTLEETKDLKLSEQILSYNEGFIENAINKLSKAMYKKLENTLGEVREDIFNEILK